MSWVIGCWEGMGGGGCTDLEPVTLLAANCLFYSTGNSSGFAGVVTDAPFSSSAEDSVFNSRAGVSLFKADAEGRLSGNGHCG